MPGKPIEEVSVHCPYCGKPLDMVVDCSAGDQRYAEDCQVCCQPMDMAITLDSAGFPTIEDSREDEA